jgi:crotonobetainyl-CoA:carnitine CoA-transferase CaiB-like acyl-CoA transferase
LRPLSGLGFAERAERCREIDEALARWARPLAAAAAAASLRHAGIPAAALATARDLVACPHLQARGFWEPDDAGVLPGLPWRASFGHVTGPAPALGADTDAVLREVLDLSDDEIAALRATGALG